MSVEAISSTYIVMLILRALLLSYMFVRCSYALYYNHLEHKVRIVIWGTAALGFGNGLEAWMRAYGRVQQLVEGVIANQPNPQLALWSLVLANVCLFIWVISIELTTHLGTVPLDVPRRRQEDPKRQKEEV